MQADAVDAASITSAPPGKSVAEATQREPRGVAFLLWLLALMALLLMVPILAQVIRQE
jgi:hypothetical protein